MLELVYELIPRKHRDTAAFCRKQPRAYRKNIIVEDSEMISRYLLTLVFLLVAWPTAATGQERLTLAVQPYLAAAELFDRFTPLAIYLSERLEAEVTLELSADYLEHIEKVGHDQVEIAYIGPAPYVRMVESFGEKPILGRIETDGTPDFQGVIIVREDAPFTELSELRNRSFAFGDPNSTMSHLLPRHMLLQEGIDIDDLSGFAFIRNHHNVVLGVLMGTFDAGAVKEEIYEEFEGKGIRMMAVTPRISEHLFVAAATVPPETVATLRRSLQELGESPAGLEILTRIQHDVTGLVPATNEDYDELRTIIQKLAEQGVVLE
jgi:phosphonate transport system substrate-binding protein